MAVRFIPFHPGHLEHLALQRAQQGERAAVILSPAIAGELRHHGIALTALGHTEQPGVERVLGCGGIINQWQGRAIAWALVSRLVLPEEWIAITRRVRGAVETAHRAGVWRIEAQADAGFPQAMRWLELMGFAREALMRGYSPVGRDCWLYARVDRQRLAAAREV